MTVKIAIIGAGWVSEARHLPALRRLRNAEVIGIVDPDESRAKSVAVRFGIPHVSTAVSVDAIPWFADASAVCISTPPRHHYGWMSSCLDLGKDVLIEKPLALTRAEAEDLDHRVQAHNVMACVMHNTLFSRSSIRARRLLNAGVIGQLSAVQIRLLNSPRRHLPGWYENLPFGLLYDELSHFLYQSDSLVPDLRVCGAGVFPSPKGNATPALATIRLEGNGIPVEFSLNFESPVCEWHAKLIGTKGLLINDMFRDILVRLPDDREHRAADHFRTLAYATAGTWAGFLSSGARHLAGRLDFGVGEVMRRFVSACETRQPPERIAWPDALRIFRLLQDCIDALQAAL